MPPSWQNLARQTRRGPSAGYDASTAEAEFATMNDAERKHIEQLIERWVQTSELSLEGKSLLAKIDILERVLEELRYHHQYPESQLRLEEYSHVSAGPSITFAPPAGAATQRSSTSRPSAASTRRTPNKSVRFPGTQRPMGVREGGSLRHPGTL